MPSGRFSFLVLWARLELARLAPLPPQDSVSTNSTTRAFAPVLLRCYSDSGPRLHRSRLFGRPRSSVGSSSKSAGKSSEAREAPSSSSGIFLISTAHPPSRLAALPSPLAAQVGQRQAGRKKQRRKNCRHARKKLANRAHRKPCPTRLRRNRARVGALAALQKHQRDNQYRDQRVCINNCCCNCIHQKLSSVKCSAAAHAQSPENPPLSATRRRSGRRRYPACRKQSRRIVPFHAAAVQYPQMPSASDFSILGLAPERPRMPACTSCACSGVAVIPVPIAQTGS